MLRQHNPREKITSQQVKRAVLLLGLVIYVVATVMPVLGAPTDVASWNFEDQDLVVDMLDPLVSIASMTGGPGLSGPTYETGNAPSANWAPEYSAWSTSGCGPDDYVEVALDMSNIGGIVIRFDDRRSATGPTDYEIHYSVNGGTFSPLSGGSGATTASFGPNPMHSIVVTPGSTDDLAMRGQANVRFRIYACMSGGNGGKWRIDNLLISASANPTAVELRGDSSAGAASGWTASFCFLASTFLFLSLWGRKRHLR